MMDRRQIGGGPFDQQHIGIAAQGGDVLFPSLDEQHITRRQADLGDPATNHPRLALQADDDAMRVVTKADLLQRPADQARGRRYHDLDQYLAAGLPAAGLFLGFRLALGLIAKLGVQEIGFIPHQIGQRLAGGGEHQDIARQEGQFVIERRHEGVFAALEDADGNLLQLREITAEWRQPVEF